MQAALLNFPSLGNFVGSSSLLPSTKLPSGVCTRSSETNVPSIITCEDSSDSLARILCRKDRSGHGLGSQVQEVKRKSSAADDLAGKKQKLELPKQPDSRSLPQKSALESFRLDELQRKTAKDLSELLRERKLPMTGKKEDLINRLIQYQRNLKMSSK